MAKIIIISGKAQHGKDLTATVLSKKLEERGNRTLIVHFADYLKFICQQYFGWNGVKDDEGRTILQTQGTDKARFRSPDIWVNVIGELLKAFHEDYDYILIPDARFPNELTVLKNKGFDTTSIRVTRVEFVSTLTDLQKQHESEIALDDFPHDYNIETKSGLVNVENAVDLFLWRFS